MTLPLPGPVPEQQTGGHQRRHRHRGSDRVDPVGSQQQPDEEPGGDQSGHRPGRRQAEAAGGGAQTH